MRELLKLFRVLVFIFMPLLVLSQPRFKHTHYSTEDGLSHDIITHMFKDRNGFMWFGTWNGINRFDGHQFISYRSSPGDMSHLKNDRIDQITEDNFNHLWIKAYDGMVYRFDKEKEQFSSVKTLLTLNQQQQYDFSRIFTSKDRGIWLQTTHSGLIRLLNPQSDTPGYQLYSSGLKPGYQLPDNNISFFFEDSQNDIWIGTGKGVAKLSSDRKGKYLVSLLDGTRGKSITCIVELKGRIFIGTNDGELVVFDKSSGQCKIVKAVDARINALLPAKQNQYLYATTSSGNFLVFDYNGGLIGNFTYSRGNALNMMFEDKGGDIWIEPHREGVIKYNAKTGVFKTYRQINNARNNYPGEHFRVIEDIEGRVWVNLKGGGFGYYNPLTDRLEYFYNQPNSPDKLLSNIVIGVYYDPAGIMWLRTDERGVEKIVFQPKNFDQHLLVKPEVFRTDNEVRGLFQDRLGRLWIGAKGGKLYVSKDGKEFNDIFINMPSNGLGLVYTILEDSRGSVWLGTKANGLYRADPVNGERSRYQLFHFTKTKGKFPISSDEIYSLLEDKRGRIWIGTFDQGLNLFFKRGADEGFIHDREMLSRYPVNRFRKIRHIGIDAKENLWLGTTDGLLVASETTKDNFRFVPFQKIAGDKTSLGKNDIQYVFRDSENRMWLATAGGGLNLAIGNDPLKGMKFKVFTTANGLANDYVLSCVESPKNILWISSLNGLSRFDLTRQAFRNYSTYDGLPNVSFSEAASVKINGDSLAFGTIRGYITFSPKHIQDRLIDGVIVFTNLQINNNDVRPGKSEVLDKAINLTDKISLRHDQNIISVDYTVLDYRSEDKQVYAYRLIGFDEEWNTGANSRRATYTNLPAGSYVLEVKCVSPGLYQQMPIRRLEITINPPFWKTWWAFLLYLFIVIIIVEIIRRALMTMLKLRNSIALEKSMAALKMNFFTNVSHELRTPLTLIMSPIEEISKTENLSDRGRLSVELIRKNADRMSKFFNQMLEIRKLQSGSASLNISRFELVAFTREVMSYFKGVADSKNILFSLTTASPTLEVWADADKLETVIYNLLSNAFKFTPNGKVISVDIQDVNDSGAVHIAVADQGKGIAEDKLESIFEMFYEGDESAGKDNPGTGIGLALSREITALHEGEIAAKINQYGGLTVSIVLPVSFRHYQDINAHFCVEKASLHGLESIIADGEIKGRYIQESSREKDSPVILLVEDNDDLRAFIQSQLSKSYRVEVAFDGQDGLEKAEIIQPDLILSDVMMPRMNGLLMLQRIRKNHAISHIPVVLLTAKSAIQNQIEALEYGADYYITKPFHRDFLMAAIANLIKKRKDTLDALLDDQKIVKLSPGEIKVDSQDEIFLAKIKQIVEEKMADQDFNIETVPDNLNIGRTAFYRKFKGLTGITPIDFVKEMRLLRAQQYLDGDYGNVSEVAYAVGFNNAKYFGTCFKSKFGISPSEYLKAKAGQ